MAFKAQCIIESDKTSVRLSAEKNQVDSGQLQRWRKQRTSIINQANGCDSQAVCLRPPSDYVMFPELEKALDEWAKGEIIKK